MADGELCGKAVATHPVVSVKSSTIEIHNGSRRVREFIAGGIAGCVAKGMVSPFDRIKILRQGEHRIHANLSIIKSAQTIVRQEGFMQLWRGFPSLVIRIFPYAGIQFLMIDVYKRQWNSVYSRKMVVSEPVKNLICGSATGLTATLLTYPLDTIRTRMLFTTKYDQDYRTWSTTVRSIYSSCGLKGFFNGMSPALWGMIPYAGISFGTYESLREMVLSYPEETLYGLTLRRTTPDGKIVSNWYMNSLCGVAAGLLSQFVCFPIDTAKRRMQNAKLIKSQAALKNSLSILDTWMDLWQRGGVRLIYRGFSLNIIRALPATATSFTVNEHVRELFQVPRSRP